MPPVCPECKKELKSIEKEVWPRETFECWIDEAGEYHEKEKAYEPEEVTYCCPECGEILPFHHSEDATAFLKGELVQ